MGHALGNTADCAGVLMSQSSRVGRRINEHGQGRFASVVEHERFSSYASLVNRGPDCDGASTSSVAERDSAVSGIHDSACAVPRGNACRRDLHCHPNYGNPDGHDHRCGPERCRLEV